MGARGRAPSGAGSAEGTAGGGAAAAGPARYLTLHVATRAEPYYFRAEQPQECAAWVAGLRLVAERTAGQPDLGRDSVQVRPCGGPGGGAGEGGGGGVDLGSLV